MTTKTLLPRSRRARLILAAGGVALTLGSGFAVAQTQPMQPVQWDNRRLDQLDRNVRRLERALTQRNAAGQPVLVEPDPEVIALQDRLANMDRRLRDLEQTFQRVNSDSERLTFQADEATRDNTALRTRLQDAEARIQKLEADAELNAPITANSATNDPAQDLAAAARLAAGDPVRGARALETVIVTWPDTPQAREANSRLGDLRVSTGDRPGAVQAYAAALRGWPRVAWAGETTLKLADNLVMTDQKPQACAALAEFGRRYAEGAAATLRTRATQIRSRADCS